MNQAITMEDMVKSDLVEGQIEPRHSSIEETTLEGSAVEVLGGDESLFALMIESSRSMLSTFGVLPENIGNNDPVDATMERIGSVVRILTESRGIQLSEMDTVRVSSAIYERSQIDLAV